MKQGLPNHQKVENALTKLCGDERFYNFAGAIEGLVNQYVETDKRDDFYVDLLDLLRTKP